jgi:serine protease Do
LKGEVIGINTAIIPWATGLGFSIPINQAMKVARRIAAGEQISHPYIGVMIVPLTDDFLQRNNIAHGVLIQSVQNASPAQRAGIQTGDVIVKIGTEKIRNSSNVLSVIARKNVGDRINVTVWRKGKTVSRQLIIGDRPAPPAS